MPQPFRNLELDLTTLYLPAGFWEPVSSLAQALVPVSLVVPFAVVVRRYLEHWRAPLP